MNDKLDEAIKKLESLKDSGPEEIVKLLKDHKLLFEDQKRVLRQYRKLYSPDLVEPDENDDYSRHEGQQHQPSFFEPIPEDELDNFLKGQEDIQFQNDSRA